MVDLTRDRYDAVVRASETYRTALVVRLAGEAGLRTGEITRVTPRHLRESASTSDAFLLAVPAAGGDDAARTDGRPVVETDDRIDRETHVPASLGAEIRRYADSQGLGEDEPYVDVSDRRIQMLVGEAASRAADRTNDPELAEATPRDLRQFFARRLLVDRDVDPYVVREAGGWGTLRALDDYLEPLDGESIATAIDERTERNRAADRTMVTEALVALVDAADGASLRVVVDRLAAADRWELAWIVRGSARAGSSGAATVSDGDRDRLAELGLDDEGPWSRVLSDGVPSTTDVTAESAGRSRQDEATPERVETDTAVVDGERRPVLAVPVSHRGATYGALCVLAAEPGRIDAAARREFALLGRVLGWSTAATRWRELLHADAVIELEFLTEAETAAFTAVSTALDCRIELQSTVAVADGNTRCYLTVTGAGPQAVADAVSSTAGLSDVRLIETREDGCVISVLVTDGSTVHTLAEHGAAVRSATAENDRVRVVCAVPTGTDVRPVATAMREAFPDAQLLSKESVARSPVTDAALREAVTERFTDRQWTALSAAYHGGYFDWPRESTAEEVADVMGVSSPTFHNHLRKAQRALLDAVFEGEAGKRM